MDELSVIVCTNRTFSSNKPACANSGSEALADRLEELLAEEGLAVTVRRIECFGQCAQGPNLRIAPGGRFFYQCSEKHLAEIIEELHRIMQLRV